MRRAGVWDCKEPRQRRPAAPRWQTARQTQHDRTEASLMLADHPTHATLPATDLERARQFYAEKVGLIPEAEVTGGLFYRCGENTGFVLFASQDAANGVVSQAGWTVDDIEAEVAALKACGVRFVEYDTPALKTVNSIATVGPIKVASFQDSEGNLLGLRQVVSASQEHR
ncbi:MAG: VOC family protein [Ktedonobacterales bacterium]